MGNGKAGNDELKGSKLFDVSHVTALVTGGGTGIGLMITQALVANGAKVYITSRRDEVLKKTDELYDSGPGQIIPLQGDVRYVSSTPLINLIIANNHDLAKKTT
jgi:NAD(P)-dependent dehydrogenase (short-subunit alcohol dehydrogenase family)